MSKTVCRRGRAGALIIENSSSDDDEEEEELSAREGASTRFQGMSNGVIQRTWAYTMWIDRAQNPPRTVFIDMDNVSDDNEE